MAKLMKAVTTGGCPPHAVAGAGWWRRASRLHHPVVIRPAPLADHLASGREPDAGCPLLILGATGTLGQALARACESRGLAFHLTSRSELDLHDPASIAAALDRYKPWGVINAAGWVRVDDAEDEREACMRVNADGAIALTKACESRNIATVNFSSDLVFGSASQSTYRESDEPAPLNVYGESKWRMEQEVARLRGEHLVIRTAAFFSPHDPYNFAAVLIDHLRRGIAFPAAADSVVTPTYVPHLCDAALDLLIDGQTGLWHLSNEEAVSWAQFAVRLARACNLDEALIEFVPSAELDWNAIRPAASALVSEKGALMPNLSHAIERFAREIGGCA